MSTGTHLCAVCLHRRPDGVFGVCTWCKRDGSIRRVTTSAEPVTERIVSAAIRVPGIDVEGYAPYKLIISVPAPGRHHHVAWFLAANGVDERDQGFLTSTGRFVDRKEAVTIAEAAGQRLRVSGSQETLYSEDLW